MGWDDDVMRKPVVAAGALLLLGGVAGARPTPQALPSQVLDLSSWMLTLPSAAPGRSTATQVPQPELRAFTQHDVFEVRGSAVSFRAAVGGATTQGSHYPRTELREMQPGGEQKASWSTTHGTHTMTVREASTHLPAVKSQVVVAQIHDASSDVIEVVADGTHNRPRICLRYQGKTQPRCLDEKYVMGTFFTLRVVAAKGRIKVSYNGTQVFDLAARAHDCYFKAGAYTQSNPSKGDKPSDYGETLISSIEVTHTA
ncbi:MAG: Alginate lyase 2 [Frankiales bacterium]|nr:Alginate lyase 2 [Frankiales bacterium]